MPKIQVDADQNILIVHEFDNNFDELTDEKDLPSVLYEIPDNETIYAEISDKKLEQLKEIFTNVQNK